MAIDPEKLLRDIQHENRRFAVLFVLSMALALAAGFALSNWRNNLPLFYLAPLHQTAPAQPLAPG